jgi:hypothetical protein
MSNKILKDEKIWDVKGFPITLKFYDSEITIKDENGNYMRISKKEPLSMVLDVIGIFKTE